MTNDSRRRFLTGGAVAAVGAAVSTVAPRAAEARVIRESCETYYPNDALAQAIVKAWTDTSYRNRLLSFPTNNFASPQSSSSAALLEVGYSVENPIVVTEEQYIAYLNLVRNKPPANFFVLPAPRESKTMDAARAAMAVTCNGM
jgi:hypothetical protein